MIHRITTATASSKPPPPDDPDVGRWQVERRIPLSLLAAMLAQLIALAVWATWLDARITHLEEVRERQIDLGENFARLEERIEGMREHLIIIRHQLERRERE